MLRYTLLILIASSLLIISSCSEHNKINKFNSASTYVDEFSGKFMQQQVYHLNDSISELAIRIDASKIPGLKSNQVDVYSLMTFRYEVYTSLNKKDLIQSDSYKLSELVAYNKLKSGGVGLQIPLMLQQNYQYIILLSVLDQVNKKNFFKMLRITKDDASPDNYRITNENGQLIWYPWIEKDQKIIIEYRYPKVNKVFISYFLPKFSPAKTPYTEMPTANYEFNRAKAFENFEVQLVQGKSQIMQLPKEGAYVLHHQAKQMSGKLITQFYGGYPELNNKAQMVFALRYLNSKKEFSLMLQDEPEHTVQEFWFFEGRSKERSTQMMKTYYSRVLRANELFTSYKEGWKTDRGMMFIIYGPPDHIYNEADREVWEYGSDASYNDLRFDFIITKTPLNPQEYVLLRTEDFKDSWYALLENWRNE